MTLLTIAVLKMFLVSPGFDRLPGFGNIVTTTFSSPEYGHVGFNGYFTKILYTIRKPPSLGAKRRKTVWPPGIWAYEISPCCMVFRHRRTFKWDV